MSQNQDDSVASVSTAQFDPAAPFDAALFVTLRERLGYRFSVNGVWVSECQPDRRSPAYDRELDRALRKWAFGGDDPMRSRALIDEYLQGRAANAPMASTEGD
jgi:hypothetical protein